MPSRTNTIIGGYTLGKRSLKLFDWITNLSNLTLPLDMSKDISPSLLSNNTGLFSATPTSSMFNPNPSPLPPSTPLFSPSPLTSFFPSNPPKQQNLGWGVPSAVTNNLVKTGTPIVEQKGLFREAIQPSTPVFGQGGSLNSTTKNETPFSSLFRGPTTATSTTGNTGGLFVGAFSENKDKATAKEEPRSLFPPTNVAGALQSSTTTDPSMPTVVVIPPSPSSLFGGSMGTGTFHSMLFPPQKARDEVKNPLFPTASTSIQKKPDNTLTATLFGQKMENTPSLSVGTPKEPPITTPSLFGQATPKNQSIPEKPKDSMGIGGAVQITPLILPISFTHPTMPSPLVPSSNPAPNLLPTKAGGLFGPIGTPTDPLKKEKELSIAPSSLFDNVSKETIEIPAVPDTPKFKPNETLPDTKRKDSMSHAPAHGRQVSFNLSQAEETPATPVISANELQLPPSFGKKISERLDEGPRLVETPPQSPSKPVFDSREINILNSSIIQPSEPEQIKPSKPTPPSTRQTELVVPNLSGTQPPKPPPARTISVTSVSPVELSFASNPSPTFTSYKDLLTLISQKRPNKSELKQQILQKPIIDMLFLSDKPEFVLTGENFTISEKAMPHYSQTNINLKRFLFDLLGLFKQITQYSDYRCLNIMENFLSDVRYYEEFRSSSFQPNKTYFEEKRIYEFSLDGNVRLNTFSEEVNKIMEMLIDEELIMANLVCKSVLILDQAFSKSQFSKIFNKDQLMDRYWTYYFHLLQKPSELDNSIMQYFYSRKKIQTRKFSKFLLYLSDSLKHSSTISKDLLFNIIDRMDGYVGEDSLIEEMVNKDTEIERIHQHILLILLEFKELKDRGKSVFSKYPDLRGRILSTNSGCLLPFRDIIPEFSMEVEGNQHIHSDYKRVLGCVDGPEWVHWLELYMKRGNIPTPELEVLIPVLEKVFSTDEALDELFRTNFLQEYSHPLFSHLLTLKKIRNHRLLYRIYLILLGSDTHNHSQQILAKYIKDQEWVEYILKPMLIKFKETALQQSILIETSEDSNSKLLFLLRLIVLNPEKIHVYGNKIFKSERYGSCQLVVFLLDCLNYYASKEVRSHRMLSHIFRAINRLLTNKSTSADLLYCVGLYHTVASNDTNTHILLKFIPEINRVSKSAEIKQLQREIKTHLQILLDTPSILLKVPEYSTFSVDGMAERFRHRYGFTSKEEVWNVLMAKQEVAPASPWIRSIAGVLKGGDVDYRLVGNLVRKFLYKSCENYDLNVPFLSLIRDILNEVPIVESLLKKIDLSTSECMSAVLTRKQLFQLLREDNTQSNIYLQDALYLLHILLNLLCLHKRLQTERVENYYSNTLNSLKCLYDIKNSFLLNPRGFGEDGVSLHPIVNLFSLINFEAQRLLPFKNNPTFPKRHLKILELRSPDFKQIQPFLDYSYLLNPVSCPFSKDYLCIQSISINTFKVLTAILHTYEGSFNVAQLFNRSFNLNISETAIRLISFSLSNFETNQEEAIVAIEFVQAALKHQYKFLEPLLYSSNGVFEFLGSYFQSKNNSVELFEKSIGLLAEVARLEGRKMVSNRLNERDYKLLAINKLKTIDKGEIRSLHEVQVQNNTQEILERIISQRSILDHARFIHSVDMLMEITLAAIFKRERPLEYLKTLLEYIKEKQLISTLNYWVLPYPDFIERTSSYQLHSSPTPLHHYLTSSLLFHHMGNFRNDPLETHTLNCVTQIQTPFKHLIASTNNTYKFMESLTQTCYKSVYNLLVFLLNCNNQGYLMSTQPLQIQKSSPASSLYCQFHQPQIAFTFLDVFSHNSVVAMSFLKSMVRELLDDLSDITYPCNYLLATRLLSTYLHALASDKTWNANGRQVVEEMLEKMQWASEKKDLMIGNPVAAKMAVQLLMMAKQYNLKSNSLTELEKCVTRAIKTHTDSETKTNLLAALLLLIKMKIAVKVDVTDLLSQRNGSYFYSVMRVLIEHSLTHSLSIVSNGVIPLLSRHSTLANLNQCFSFYNNQSRNQTQLGWLWTLALIKHIVVSEGKNPLVMNEVLKFLNDFATRILSVLDAPNHREFVPTYAYIEELHSTLQLLSISFKTFSNMSLATKNYLERLQYSLLHNTIFFFQELKNPHLIEPQTSSEVKLRNISTSKETLKRPSHSPNVFSLSVQSLYIQSLVHYFSLATSCLKHSQFVKYHFEKPLENTNILYTNYFWLHTNRNIHQLQINVLALYREFSEYTPNIFQDNETAWKSPQLFSANGYLPSIKTYPTKADTINSLNDASLLLTRMGLVYLKQQQLYRRKYLSLVAEDIEDFRAQQVKFAKTVMSMGVDRKQAQRRWSPLVQEYSRACLPLPLV